MAAAVTARAIQWIAQACLLLTETVVSVFYHTSPSTPRTGCTCFHAFLAGLGSEAVSRLVNSRSMSREDQGLDRQQQHLDPQQHRMDQRHGVDHV